MDHPQKQQIPHIDAAIQKHIAATPVKKYFMDR